MILIISDETDTTTKKIGNFLDRIQVDWKMITAKTQIKVNDLINDLLEAKSIYLRRGNFPPLGASHPEFQGEAKVIFDYCITLLRMLKLVPAA